jgi:hypothetical protein
MKYRGTLGTAVCNFFYVYYQFPFLLSLPKNRNHPSNPSHFGVTPPPVEGKRFMAAGVIVVAAVDMRQGIFEYCELWIGECFKMESAGLCGLSGVCCF